MNSLLSEHPQLDTISGKQHNCLTRPHHRGQTDRWVSSLSFIEAVSRETGKWQQNGALFTQQQRHATLSSQAEVNKGQLVGDVIFIYGKHVKSRADGSNTYTSHEMATTKTNEIMSFSPFCQNALSVWINAAFSYLRSTACASRSRNWTLCFFIF